MRDRTDNPLRFGRDTRNADREGGAGNAYSFFVDGIDATASSPEIDRP